MGLRVLTNKVKRPRRRPTAAFLINEVEILLVRGVMGRWRFMNVVEIIVLDGLAVCNLGRRGEISLGLNSLGGMDKEGRYQLWRKLNQDSSCQSLCRF